MINFRWHRGSLEDSLATSVSFCTNASFKRYIIQQCQLKYLYVFDENETFDIKDYGYDERCKQHLKSVLVNGAIIGFIFE